MKYQSPEEAVRLVKSGDTIVVQGSTSIPMVLLRALTKRADELRDVKIISGFGVHPEEAPYAKEELMDSFRARNIFVPNNLRGQFAWIWVDTERRSLQWLARCFRCLPP